MKNTLQKTSKFLSYVLRHQPEAIGIRLESDGWIDIKTLITQANQHGESLTHERILQVAETSDKKRFTVSEDGLKIRAAQGHSTQQVQVNHTEKEPPELLYHGTATRFLESIKAQGLISKSRHHVHLSADEETAIAVGKRHGKPIVLIIKAHLMCEKGFKFYLSDNNVWLTESVPVEFIVE